MPVVFDEVQTTISESASEGSKLENSEPDSANSEKVDRLKQFMRDQKRLSERIRAD